MVLIKLLFFPLHWFFCTGLNLTAAFSFALVFLHWVAAGFLHWIAGLQGVGCCFLILHWFNLTAIFSSALVATSGASTANAATQEAVVEDAVKAKWLGCCRILFMCNGKRVAQVCNFSCTPSWQEKIMVADTSNLMQNFNNINENGYVPFNK